LVKERSYVAGYMSASTGIGYLLPLGRWVSAQPGFHVGFAGGSGVDTGGGLTLEPKLDVRLHLSQAAHLAINSSYLVSTGGSFDVPTLSVGAGIVLKTYRSKAAVTKPITRSVSDQRTRQLRFSVSTQRYFLEGTAPSPTSPLVLEDADFLGLNFDLFVLPWLYLNAGSYWAYRGNGGTYANGLLGVGVQKEVGRFQVGLAASAGAGECGGLPCGEGSVWTAKGTLGLALSESTTLFGSVGRADYLTGGDTYLAEVGLAYGFGLPIG
jgi:hypothetical protein